MFHLEGGLLTGLGKVRLVISFENQELTSRLCCVGEQPGGLVGRENHRRLPSAVAD